MLPSFAVPAAWGRVEAVDGHLALFSSGVVLMASDRLPPQSAPKRWRDWVLDEGVRLGHPPGSGSDEPFAAVEETWVCGGLVFKALTVPRPATSGDRLDSAHAGPLPDPAGFSAGSLLDERALAGTPTVAAASAGPSTPHAVAGPVTSWAGVARAVGVSVDTLARRRTRWGWSRPPYFSSAEEAVEWYRSGERGVLSQPATGSTPRAGRSPKTTPRRHGTTLAELLAQAGTARPGGRGSR